MPERIQRKRTKGWRMPANTIYVGRPTKWGNPYNAKGFVYRGVAVKHYEKWITKGRGKHLLEHLSELRGKNLACWCAPGDLCHANVLLRLANEEQPQ